LPLAALGAAALSFLGVPAALFAGDRRAAITIAIIASTALAFTYLAGKAGRKKALESLRQLSQSADWSAGL